LITKHSEDAEGNAMYIGGTTVAFSERVTRSSLEAALRHAWLRARHLAPAIACKTLKGDDESWRFQYEVPDPNEADQWAKDTLIGHADPRYLVEYIHELEAQWWTLDDRHYNIYLHVLPASEDGGDWHMVCVLFTFIYRNVYLLMSIIIDIRVHTLQSTLVL
jgi:hypothetical protein